MPNQEDRRVSKILWTVVNGIKGGRQIEKAEIRNFSWAYRVNKVIMYRRAVSVEWCLQ